MKEMEFKHNNLHSRETTGAIRTDSVANAISRTIISAISGFQDIFFISSTIGIESKTYGIVNIHYLKKNKFI